MMTGGSFARSASLPLIAPSRLGPGAVQGRADHMAGQTMMPCGGLTVGQIKAVEFALFADLARWGQKLRRIVTRRSQNV